MLSYMSNKKLIDTEFRRMTGVKIKTFNYLLQKLKSVTPEQKSGPKKTLSLRKELLLTLDYWRNYNSLLTTGKKYKVSESTACRIYRSVELRLARAGVCKLPGKKSLLTEIEESFTIDATECPVERPKRKPKSRIKNKKKDPLTKQDKLKNKEQAKKRVVVEHVIGHLKKFKIISQKYRNRRKRFTLKFNLICGIYNYENQG